LVEVLGGLETELGNRQGVEAEHVVPALEGISRISIEVEAGASGHENLLLRRPAVEDPFEVVPPGTVPVNLVEDPDRVDREFSFQDSFAVFSHVPVEVTAISVGQAQCHGGLADLAWSGDKHHLSWQVVLHLGPEVTINCHMEKLTCFLYTSQIFQ
jgi:hypothetical protein